MEKQQRRKAVAAYKARRQRGGVFQIRNTQTGRILLRRTARLARQRKPLPVRADDRFLHRPRPAGGLAKRWLDIRF